MRNHMFARYAKVEELPTMLEWIKRISDINLVDPQIFHYPATEVLAAVKDNQPQLFMPIQPTLMLESLAPKPELSPIDEAAALKVLTQTAAWEARRRGMGELYFLCSDERVIKFGQAHGYELVNVPVLRMKL